MKIRMKKRVWFSLVVYPLIFSLIFTTSAVGSPSLQTEKSTISSEKKISSEEFLDEIDLVENEVKKGNSPFQALESVRLDAAALGQVSGDSLKSLDGEIERIIQDESVTVLALWRELKKNPEIQEGLRANDLYRILDVIQTEIERHVQESKGLAGLLEGKELAIVGAGATTVFIAGVFWSTLTGAQSLLPAPLDVFVFLSLVGGMFGLGFCLALAEVAAVLKKEDHDLGSGLNKIKGIVSDVASLQSLLQTRMLRERGEPLEDFLAQSLGAEGGLRIEKTKTSPFLKTAKFYLPGKKDWVARVLFGFCYKSSPDVTLDARAISKSQMSPLALKIINMKTKSGYEGRGIMSQIISDLIQKEYPNIAHILFYDLGDDYGKPFVRSKLVSEQQVLRPLGDVPVSEDDVYTLFEIIRSKVGEVAGESLGEEVSYEAIDGPMLERDDKSFVEILNQGGIYYGDKLADYRDVSFWEDVTEEPYSFAARNLKGELIGFVFAKKSDYLKKTINISHLYVRQGVRGSGIGTTLLGLVTQAAKKNNFENITLVANAKEERLLRFYKRFGFKKISEPVSGFEELLVPVKVLLEKVRKSAAGKSLGQTAEIEKIWSEAGLETESPFTDKSQEALHRISELSPLMAPEGSDGLMVKNGWVREVESIAFVPAETYYKVLFAELFSTGNQTAVLDFFNFIQTMENLEAKSVYLNSAKFLQLYFIALLMDGQSLREFSYVPGHFINYFNVKVAPFLEVSKAFQAVDPIDFFAVNFNLFEGIVREQITRGNYLEALRLLNNYQLIIDREKDVNPEMYKQESERIRKVKYRISVDGLNPSDLNLIFQREVEVSPSDVVTLGFFPEVFSENYILLIGQETVSIPAYVFNTNQKTVVETAERLMVDGKFNTKETADRIRQLVGEIESGKSLGELEGLSKQLKSQGMNADEIRAVLEQRFPFEYADFYEYETGVKKLASLVRELPQPVVIMVVGAPAYGKARLTKYLVDEGALGLTPGSAARVSEDSYTRGLPPSFETREKLFRDLEELLTNPKIQSVVLDGKDAESISNKNILDLNPDTSIVWLRITTLRDKESKLYTWENEFVDTTGWRWPEFVRPAKKYLEIYEIPESQSLGVTSPDGARAKKMLESWLDIWAEVYGEKLTAHFVPAYRGTPFGNILLRNGEGRGVVWLHHTVENKEDFDVSILDQTAIASYRGKRLMTLLHLFLINLYPDLKKIHYGVLLAGGDDFLLRLKKHGLFESVDFEKRFSRTAYSVVDRRFVNKLLNDKQLLEQLIRREGVFAADGKFDSAQNSGQAMSLGRDDRDYQAAVRVLERLPIEKITYDDFAAYKRAIMFNERDRRDWSKGTQLLHEAVFRFAAIPTDTTRFFDELEVQFLQEKVSWWERNEGLSLLTWRMAAHLLHFFIGWVGKGYVEGGAVDTLVDIFLRGYESMLSEKPNPERLGGVFGEMNRNLSVWASMYNVDINPQKNLDTYIQIAKNSRVIWDEIKEEKSESLGAEYLVLLAAPPAAAIGFATAVCLWDVFWINQYKKKILRIRDQYREGEISQEEYSEYYYEGMADVAAQSIALYSPRISRPWRVILEPDSKKPIVRMRNDMFPLWYKIQQNLLRRSQKKKAQKHPWLKHEVVSQLLDYPAMRRLTQTIYKNFGAQNRSGNDVLSRIENMSEERFQQNVSKWLMRRGQDFSGFEKAVRKAVEGNVATLAAFARYLPRKDDEEIWVGQSEYDTCLFLRMLAETLEEQAQSLGTVTYEPFDLARYDADFPELMEITYEYRKPSLVEGMLKNILNQTKRSWKKIAGSSYSFVARSNDKTPLGYVFAAVDERNPERIQIKNFYVRKSKKGQGIGTGLLRMMIARAREDGFSECTLRVSSENEHALDFYRSLGFREVKPLKPGEEDYLRIIEMTVAADELSENINKRNKKMSSSSLGELKLKPITKVDTTRSEPTREYRTMIQSFNRWSREWGIANSPDIQLLVDKNSRLVRSGKNEVIATIHLFYWAKRLLDQFINRLPKNSERRQKIEVFIEDKISKFKKHVPARPDNYSTLTLDIDKYYEWVGKWRGFVSENLKEAHLQAETFPIPGPGELARAAFLANLWASIQLNIFYYILKRQSVEAAVEGDRVNQKSMLNQSVVGQLTVSSDQIRVLSESLQGELDVPDNLSLGEEISYEPFSEDEYDSDFPQLMKLAIYPRKSLPFPSALEGFLVETKKNWRKSIASPYSSSARLRDGTLIGYVFAVPDEDDSQKIEISNLQVRNDKWGRGVATELLTQVAVRVHEDGFTECRLKVIRSNERAMRLYRGLGFSEVDQEQRIGQSSTVIEMKVAMDKFLENLRERQQVYLESKNKDPLLEMLERYQGEQFDVRDLSEAEFYNFLEIVSFGKNLLPHMAADESGLYDYFEDYREALAGIPTFAVRQFDVKALDSIELFNFLQKIMRSLRLIEDRWDQFLFYDGIRRGHQWSEGFNRIEPQGVKLVSEHPELMELYQRSLGPFYGVLRKTDERLKAELVERFRADRDLPQRILDALHRSEGELNDFAIDWLLGIDLARGEDQWRVSEYSGEQSHYEPTPYSVLRDIIKEVEVSSQDVFYDLGTGYGRPVFYTAITTKASRVVGFELIEDRVRRAKETKAELGLDQVDFVAGNIKDADLSQGDVFFLFNPFSEDTLKEVGKKLEGLAGKKRIKIISYGPSDVFFGKQSGWLRPIKELGRYTTVYESIGSSSKMSVPAEEVLQEVQSSSLGSESEKIERNGILYQHKPWNSRKAYSHYKPRKEYQLTRKIAARNLPVPSVLFKDKKLYIQLLPHDYSLFDVVTAKLADEDKVYYDKAGLQKLFREVAKVIRFFHDKGVYHGDLAPRHILLTRNPSGSHQVYLVDFDYKTEVFDQELSQDFRIEDLWRFWGTLSMHLEKNFSPEEISVFEKEFMDQYGGEDFFESYYQYVTADGIGRDSESLGEISNSVGPKEVFMVERALGYASELARIMENLSALDQWQLQTIEKGKVSWNEWVGHAMNNKLTPLFGNLNTAKRALEAGEASYAFQALAGAAAACREAVAIYENNFKAWVEIDREKIFEKYNYKDTEEYPVPYSLATFYFLSRVFKGHPNADKNWEALKTASSQMEAVLQKITVVIQELENEVNLTVGNGFEEIPEEPSVEGASPLEIVGSYYEYFEELLNYASSLKDVHIKTDQVGSLSWAAWLRHGVNEPLGYFAVLLETMQEVVEDGEQVSLEDVELLGAMLEGGTKVYSRTHKQLVDFDLKQLTSLKPIDREDGVVPYAAAGPYLMKDIFLDDVSGEEKWEIFQKSVVRMGSALEKLKAAVENLSLNVPAQSLGAGLPRNPEAFIYEHFDTDRLEEDFEIFREMYDVEIDEEVYSIFEKQWRSKSHSLYSFVVRDVSGIPVAFVFADASYEDPTEIYIEEILVDREYRRKGVATKLLEMIGEKAEENGFRSISLLVDPGAAPAIALYDKLGFVNVKSTESELDEMRVSIETLLKKISENKSSDSLGMFLEEPDVEGLSVVEAPSTYFNYLQNLIEYIASLEEVEIETREKNFVSWRNWVKHEINAKLGAFDIGLGVIQDDLNDVERNIILAELLFDAVVGGKEVFNRVHRTIGNSDIKGDLKRLKPLSEGDVVAYATVGPYLSKAVFINEQGETNENWRKFRWAVGRMEIAFQKLESSVKNLREDLAEQAFGGMRDELKVVVFEGERKAKTFLNQEDFGAIFEDPENLKVLKEALTQNYKPADNERSVVLDLPKPIEIDNRLWTKVYLKGIRFDERRAPTPHMGNGSVMLPRMLTNRNTLSVNPFESSPNFAMQFYKAKREYENHKVLYRNEHLKTNNIFTSAPIGYGFFPNARRFNNKDRLGFVVLGISEDMPKKRGGDFSISNIGRILKNLHAIGFSHPYMHLANFAANESDWFVHDLDTGEFLPVAESEKERFVVAQIRDLAYLVMKFSRWDNFEDAVNAYFEGETADVGGIYLEMIGPLKALINRLKWGELQEISYEDFMREIPLLTSFISERYERVEAEELNAASLGEVKRIGELTEIQTEGLLDLMEEREIYYVKKSDRDSLAIKSRNELRHDLTEMLETPWMNSFVFLEDGKVLAYAVATSFREDVKGPVVLADFYVARERRGRGVGAAFFGKLWFLFKNQGVKVLTIAAIDSAPLAQNFWKKIIQEYPYRTVRKNDDDVILNYAEFDLRKPVFSQGDVLTEMEKELFASIVEAAKRQLDSGGDDVHVTVRRLHERLNKQFFYRLLQKQAAKVISENRTLAEDLSFEISLLSNGIEDELIEAFAVKAFQTDTIKGLFGEYLQTKDDFQYAIISVENVFPGGGIVQQTQRVLGTPASGLQAAGLFAPYIFKNAWIAILAEQALERDEGARLLKQKVLNCFADKNGWRRLTKYVKEALSLGAREEYAEKLGSLVDVSWDGLPRPVQDALQIHGISDELVELVRVLGRGKFSEAFSGYYFSGFPKNVVEDADQWNEFLRLAQIYAKPSVVFGTDGPENFMKFLKMLTFMTDYGIGTNFLGRLAESTQTHNRPFILGSFLRRGPYEGEPFAVTVYQDRVGRDNYEDFNLFLLELIEKHPNQATQIVDGLLVGLDAGDIQMPLSDDQKEAIHEFIDISGGFFRELFKYYKNEGGDAVESLKVRSERILTDSWGEDELRLIENEFDERGYDGERMLPAIINLVIPASGATTLTEDDIQTIFKRQRAAGDLRGHIPEVVQGVDLLEGQGVIESRKTYVLNTEEDKKFIENVIGILSPSEEADFDQESVRRGVLDIVNSKAYHKDVGQFLKLFLLSSNTSLVDNSIILDRSPTSIYAALNKVKNQLGRNGAAYNLILDWLEKNSAELRGATTFKPLANKKAVIQTILGIWTSEKISPADKEKKIMDLLEGVEMADLKMIAESVQEQPELKSFVEGLLKIQMLDRSDYRQLTQEIVNSIIDLIEQALIRFSPEEIRLEMRMVKGVPFSLWSVNCGTCVGTDWDLWKNPQFKLMAVIDKNKNQIVGFNHVFEMDGEKRLLAVPGLEPSVEFISTVHAKDYYRLSKQALKRLMNLGGWNQVVLPDNEYIVSSRHDVRRVAAADNNREYVLAEKVKWSDDPKYHFDSVYVLAENASLGEVVSRVERVLAITGKSLNFNKLATLSKEDIVGEIMKNIVGSVVASYTLLPVSEIVHMIEVSGLESVRGQLEIILSNSQNHIYLLWDVGISNGERSDWLETHGLSEFVRQKNFHTRPLKKDMDQKNLEGQIVEATNFLISTNVDFSSLGLMKPIGAEFETSVHSLKSDSVNSLFLLQYLIQINGDLAQDILRIFKQDPKTGDFFAELSEYLEGLFQEYQAAELTAKAA